MKGQSGYMVYWEDDEYDRLLKTEVTIKPFQYTINPMALWKPVIAEEDKEVKSGIPEIISIKKIKLPRNTMCSPLKIMRNGLGAFLSFFPLGEPTKIGEEKEFDKLVFLPVFDGKVKKGDLLGVLLVYFVNTGVLGGAMDVRETREEVERASLVYWKEGKLVREETDIQSTYFFQSSVYEYIPIISAENMKVKKGELKIIKTVGFKAPKNTVLDSLFTMRNALGDIVDIFRDGKPRKIETTREISKVVFLPVRDGEIKKGDLLNVAALHHVVVDEPAFKPVKFRAKANLVYLENGEIRREEVELEPFGHYEGTSKGNWAVLVSEENKEIKKGEVESIKIRDLVLEPGTAVSPLCGMIYALGVTLDVYGPGKPKRIEKQQKISHALLFPVFDGKVKEGEIIGILRLHRVEVSSVDKITGLLEKILEKLSMSSGKFTESSEWPHLWHKSHGLG